MNYAKIIDKSLRVISSPIYIIMQYRYLQKGFVPCMRLIQGTYHKHGI